MLFPFLTVFIVFLILLAIRYHQKSSRIKEVQDSFWEREAAANATPPVDLDSLKYITIPLEKFPLGFSDNEKILEIEKQLKSLSQVRILNLTGQTNTELKETYGVTNLTALQEIGDNYDKLSVLLKEYASYLIQEQMITEAIAVLEFGVGTGTDISQNYTLLGDCYKLLGKTEKIQLLIQQVQAKEMILTPSILRHLNELLDENSEDFSL